MTSPPAPLTCTWTAPNTHTGRIALVGELGHTTADEFLRSVSERLGAAPAMRDLHVECAELDFCDSLGLAALLTVRRRTAAAGIRLHLDNRPPALDRMLDLTGTLTHLTGNGDGA